MFFFYFFLLLLLLLQVKYCINTAGGIIYLSKVIRILQVHFTTEQITHFTEK